MMTISGWEVAKIPQKALGGQYTMQLKVTNEPDHLQSPPRSQIKRYIHIVSNHLSIQSNTTWFRQNPKHHLTQRLMATTTWHMNLIGKRYVNVYLIARCRWDFNSYTACLTVAVLGSQI